MFFKEYSFLNIFFAALIFYKSYKIMKTLSRCEKMDFYLSTKYVFSIGFWSGEGAVESSHMICSFSKTLWTVIERCGRALSSKMKFWPNALRNGQLVDLITLSMYTRLVIFCCIGINEVRRLCIIPPKTHLLCSRCYGSRVGSLKYLLAQRSPLLLVEVDIARRNIGCKWSLGANLNTNWFFLSSNTRGRPLCGLLLQPLHSFELFVQQTILVS